MFPPGSLSRFGRDKEPAFNEEGSSSYFIQVDVSGRERSGATIAKNRRLTRIAHRTGAGRYPEVRAGLFPRGSLGNGGGSRGAVEGGHGAF